MRRQTVVRKLFSSHRINTTQSVLASLSIFAALNAPSAAAKTRLIFKGNPEALEQEVKTRILNLDIADTHQTFTPRLMNFGLSQSQKEQLRALTSGTVDFT